MKRSKITGSHAGKGAATTYEGDGRTSEFSTGKVTESHQPEYTPYTARYMTLLIGASLDRYDVPEDLVKGVQELSSRLEDDDRTIGLEEIDEDVGHTLVHYLHTGEYQTLRTRDGSRQREYTRSVLAYRAATQLGMTGLADLASEQMDHSADSVDILETLDLARSVYDAVPGCVDVLSEHLTKTLKAAFYTDETFFETEGFLKCLGTEPSFVRLLVRIMGSLYHERALASERGDGVKHLSERSPREESPAMECHFGRCSLQRVTTPVGSEPYVKPESPSVLEVDCFGRPSRSGESLKRGGSFSDNPKQKMVKGSSKDF